MVRRGSVYWWRCPNHDREHIQSGSRPVVVVSNNMSNAASDIIQVVPFTTKVKTPFPTRVPMVFDSRMSIALTEQVTTIPVSELGDYISTLHDFQMQLIDNALAMQLGIKPISSSSARFSAYED